MNIKELDKMLSVWINSLKGENGQILKARLSSLKSVYPFNEYEYRIMFLLDKGIISFRDYEELRGSYTKSEYLGLYELAPRTFGETWAHKHLMDIDTRFKKPNKLLDASYDGNYDLWVQEIRVEVKASRAVDKRIKGKSLVSKAITFETNEPFWMNFQQIKKNICDVFIFIGVWVDKSCYWVFPHNFIENHPHLSPQHRGGIEYQLGITERNLTDFDKYLVEPRQLVNVIIRRAVEERKK